VSTIACPDSLHQAGAILFLKSSAARPAVADRFRWPRLFGRWRLLKPFRTIICQRREIRASHPGPSIAIFRHCFWPAQRQAQSIDAQHLPIGIDHGSIDQASISISTRQKRLIGQRRARRPTDGTAGRLGQRRTRANTVSAKMRQGPAAAFSSGRLLRRSLKQNNCG
jgi:hypothetical protein